MRVSIGKIRVAEHSPWIGAFVVFRDSDEQVVRTIPVLVFLPVSAAEFWYSAIKKAKEKCDKQHLKDAEEMSPLCAHGNICLIGCPSA